MAVKLPYRYKSGNKQYDILNNFTGGVSSMYADDIITDKTYREINNWDIVNGGLLEKREGTTYHKGADNITLENIRSELSVNAGVPVTDDITIASSKEIRTAAKRFRAFTFKYKAVGSQFYTYDVMYAEIKDDGTLSDFHIMKHEPIKAQALKDVADAQKRKEEVYILPAKYNMSPDTKISDNVALAATNLFITNPKWVQLKAYVGQYYGRITPKELTPPLSTGPTDAIENYILQNKETFLKKINTKPIVWADNGVIYTKFFLNVVHLITQDVHGKYHFTVTTVPYISMDAVGDSHSISPLVKSEVELYNAGLRGVTAKTTVDRGFNLAAGYSIFTDSWDPMNPEAMSESKIRLKEETRQYFSSEILFDANDLEEKSTLIADFYKNYAKPRTDLVRPKLQTTSAKPTIDAISIIEPLVPSVGEPATLAFDIDPSNRSSDWGVRPLKAPATTVNYLWVNVMVWDADEFSAYNTSLQDVDVKSHYTKPLSKKWYRIYKDELPGGVKATDEWVSYNADVHATRITFTSTAPKTIVVASRFQHTEPTTDPDYTADPMVTYNIIPQETPVAIKIQDEIDDFHKATDMINYKGSTVFYGETSKLFKAEGLIGHNAYTRGGRIINLNTDETITRLQGFYDTLIAASPHKLFVVKYNKEGRLTAVELNKDIGVVAPKSTVNNLNSMFFLSHEGVFKLKSLYNFEDRYNVEKVDKPIADQIRKELDIGAKNALAVVNNDKYYLFFPTSGKCFIYYNEWQGWVSYTSEAFKHMDNLWTWEGKLQWTRDDSPYIHSFGLHDISERKGVDLYEKHTTEYLRDYKDEEGHMLTKDEQYPFLLDTHPNVMYNGNEEMKTSEKLTYDIPTKEDKIYRDIWFTFKKSEEKSNIKSQLKTKRLTFDGIMHMKKFKQLHVKTFNRGDVERLYAKVLIDDGIVVDTAEWDFELDATGWKYIHRTKPNIVTNNGMGMADNHQNIDPTGEYDGGETIAQERVVGGMFMDVSGIGETPFNLHKVIVPGKGLAIQYDITHEDETYIAISEIATVYKTKKPKPRIYQSNKLYTK